MNDKILLAKGECEGNLKETRQLYYVYYLLKVLEDGNVKFTDKLEFALVTPSEHGDGEKVYRSFRMNDPAQTRLLIKDLVIGYGKFLKEREQLNEFCLGYRVADLQKMISETLKDVVRGVYDG